MYKIIILILEILFIQLTPVIFSFSIAKNDDLNVRGNVTFLVIGDWGGSSNEPYTTEKQLEVARAMQTYARKHKIEFVISTGDNFYEEGVDSVNSIRFRKTFEEVYLKDSLKNKKWYITAGNHDHRNDNGKYQIQYSKNQHLWKFPGLFHTLRVVVHEKKITTFKFIFVDTVTICNLHDTGPIDQYDSINRAYFNLVANEISKSVENKELIFVVGHHPIYTPMSSRKHFDCMEHEFMKLFMDKYTHKVLANFLGYINGHDHILAYSKFHELRLLHSGGGMGLFSLPSIFADKNGLNNVDKNFKVQFYQNDENFGSVNGGFLAVTLDYNRFKFSFIDSKGNIIYKRYVKL